MRDKRPVFAVLMIFGLISCWCLTLVYLHDAEKKAKGYEAVIENLEIELKKYDVTPTPTPTNTPTPTSTPTSTPTPTPILEFTNQQYYDECVARGLVTPAAEDHISVDCGVFFGESGRETYYNLKMDLCVYYMRELGYDEITYPYWIRSDGAKMLGNYVMCAANWRIRPKGTIIPTSLGDAIVVDTGEFVKDYPNGVDLAVDW